MSLTHVNFPSAFESVPVVVASISTNYSDSSGSASRQAGLGVAAANATKTGFDIEITFNGTISDGNTVFISWIAVG